MSNFQLHEENKQFSVNKEPTFASYWGTKVIFQKRSDQTRIATCPLLIFWYLPTSKIISNLQKQRKLRLQSVGILQKSHVFSGSVRALPNRKQGSRDHIANNKHFKSDKILLQTVIWNSILSTQGRKSTELPSHLSTNIQS